MVPGAVVWPSRSAAEGAVVAMYSLNSGAVYSLNSGAVYSLTPSLSWIKHGQHGQEENNTLNVPWFLLDQLLKASITLGSFCNIVWNSWNKFCLWLWCLRKILS